MAKLSEFTGERPKVYNLKDNNKLANKTISIRHVSLNSGGEYGVFLVLDCIVVNNGDKNNEIELNKPIVIVTGARDIVDRILPLQTRINDGLSVEATLTKVGRKWLID